MVLIAKHLLMLLSKNLIHKVVLLKKNAFAKKPADIGLSLHARKFAS